MQSLIPSLAGDLRREKPNPTYGANINTPSTPSTGGPVGALIEFTRNLGSTITRQFLCATSTQIFLHADLIIALGGPGWALQSLPLPNGTNSNSPLTGFPQYSVINNLLHVGDGVNNWIFDGNVWVLEGMAIPQDAPSFTPFSYAATYGAPWAPTGSLVRAGGVVTVAVNTGGAALPVGINVTIAGAADASFNGTYQITGGVPNVSLTYAQPGQVDASTSSAGVTVTPVGLNIATNRYYWVSWLDQTAARNSCQSDAGPISPGTGAIGAGTGFNRVFPNTGKLNFGVTSTTININGGMFKTSDIGLALYTAISPYLLGIITAVAGNGLSCTISRVTTFGLPPPGVNFLKMPPRATHWVLYASESENSKIGNQLAIIPIPPGPSGTTGVQYEDASQFNSDPSNLFLPIERPIRNDPPVPSKIQEVHKFRIFRVRTAKPILASYTANEEVRGNLNGSPEESNPGVDVNSLSDITNEQPYPDSSHNIRAICSHGEACYFGSEKNMIPLYGQSIDDFTLSQLYAFQVGVAGRFAMASTPHGLAFVSYDRKVYLYPSQGVPVNEDATTTLVEIGRPKRTTFEQIKSDDLDNVRLKFYNFGRRNWLVLAYQDNNSVYHTWVYDFETTGWFELQRGVVSLAVFEVSDGNTVLMGGGTDGFVYVLDDLTGTFSSNSNFPVGTFRPALIDWGKPDHYHVFRYLEFEVSNALLGLSSMTVKYWLDPVDVDNPGTESGVLTISQVKGSNFFRGFARGGSLCYRLLLEFSLAADANDGVIRGINIVADEASGLIF